MSKPGTGLGRIQRWVRAESRDISVPFNIAHIIGAWYAWHVATKPALTWTRPSGKRSAWLDVLDWQMLLHLPSRRPARSILNYWSLGSLRFSFFSLPQRKGMHPVRLRGEIACTSNGRVGDASVYYSPFPLCHWDTMDSTSVYQMEKKSREYSEIFLLYFLSVPAFEQVVHYACTLAQLRTLLGSRGTRLFDARDLYQGSIAMPALLVTPEPPERFHGYSVRQHILTSGTGPFMDM